jgi:hypothetical protein
MHETMHPEQVPIYRLQYSCITKLSSDPGPDGPTE